MARLTGETNTEAIGTALRERLTGEQARSAVRIARLLAIGDRCAQNMPGPFSSVDHDESLYDEHGLPR